MAEAAVNGEHQDGRAAVIIGRSPPLDSDKGISSLDKIYFR